MLKGDACDLIEQDWVGDISKLGARKDEALEESATFETYIVL
jgi:hypothetical protein